MQPDDRAEAERGQELIKSQCDQVGAAQLAEESLGELDATWCRNEGLDRHSDIGYQSAIERVQAVTIHLLTSDWLLFHIPDDTAIGTYDD